MLSFTELCKQLNGLQMFNSRFLVFIQSSRTSFSYIPIVNSIALVKPEKAKMMESMLIQMARSGQIAGKVTLEN